MKKYFDLFAQGVALQCKTKNSKQWHNITNKTSIDVFISDKYEIREKLKTIQIDGIDLEPLKAVNYIIRHYLNSKIDYKEITEIPEYIEVAMNLFPNELSKLNSELFVCESIDDAKNIILEKHEKLLDNF